MSVPRIKAVRVDVLQRYYIYLCARIAQTQKSRTAPDRKENARAKEIRKGIKGMVEYNQLYIQKGLNPVVFVERY